MNSFTPIKNIDQKIDIIDHVNQDHREELIAIAQTQYEDVISAKIADIFEEVVQLDIVNDNEAVTHTITIPFEIEGELEDKILYLAYAAIVKQGRDLSGTGQHFFEVLSKQDITNNIVRIHIKSDTPLPEYYPGYAYAFLLKKMKKKVPHNTHSSTQKPWLKNIFDRFFIFIMKHLSVKQRNKLLRSSYKGVRLYTLRKAWKESETSPFCNRGYIDVFKHDETAGSQWASELSAGDVLLSRSETADKHQHLAQGKVLLIADETAFPALAGILEHWHNSIPPDVILLTADDAEQGYFTQEMLPAETQLHRVICAPQYQADETLNIIKNIPLIDNVWGAFESDAAKKVRHFLRNERHIKGKNNHTKAYWKLKSDES